ncbi:MAG TPA: hypothetical protein VGN16_18155, partial [Acidobacteriaceae bacterium]
MERKRLKFRAGMIAQRAAFAAPAFVLLLAASSFRTAQAQGVRTDCPEGGVSSSASSGPSHESLNLEPVAGCLPMASGAAPKSSPDGIPRLIVIGFMGGRVKANNLIHKEALLAKELQEREPSRVYAEVFANHKSNDAFKVVMKLLGANGAGHL